MQVLLIAHSLGDVVARTFLMWADKACPGWVDTHISTYAPIAPLTLGAPVTLPALEYGALGALPARLPPASCCA